MKKLRGKKPKNRQIKQSFIKVPDRLTAKQRWALAKLKSLLGYTEGEDVKTS